MYQNIISALMICGLFNTFVQKIEGCGTYRTDDGQILERRKRQTRLTSFNARSLLDTTELRTYFTNCMTALEPAASYDWSTNVDYTILDTIWFDDNALLYCGFGVETTNCWINNIQTYVKAESDIFPSVARCIQFYSEDYSKDPPYTTRFSNVPPKRRRKRQVSENAQIDTYSSCLNNSTVEMTNFRQQLDYPSLVGFIERYTVNSPCFANTILPRNPNFPMRTWPRQIVSFTRVDSPLRFSLQDCGEDVYSMVFPGRPIGNWGSWDQWSPCSASCGTGSRTRQRLCYLEEGSDISPSLSNCYCNNSPETCSRQEELCNEQICPPPVPYVWGEWRRMITCTSRCGPGFQLELRDCFRGLLRVDYLLCDGTHTRLRSCSFPPCPPAEKYAYGNWMPWGPCSATCSSFQNSGVQRRMRCPREFPACRFGDREQRPCEGIAACV